MAALTPYSGDAATGWLHNSFGLAPEEYNRRMGLPNNQMPKTPGMSTPGPAAGLPPPSSPSSSPAPMGAQPAPRAASMGLPQSGTVGYNPQSAPRPPADILRQQYGDAYNPAGAAPKSRGPGKLALGGGLLAAGMGALDIAANGANFNNVTNTALGAATLTPGLSPYAAPLLAGKVGFDAGAGIASYNESKIVGAADKLGALGNVQATGEAAKTAQQVNAMTPKAQADYWAGKRQAMYAKMAEDGIHPPAAAGLLKAQPPATENPRLAQLDNKIAETKASLSALGGMKDADWKAAANGQTTPNLQAAPAGLPEEMRDEMARQMAAGGMMSPGTGYIKNNQTGKVTLVGGRPQATAQQEPAQPAQRIPAMPAMLPFNVRPGARDFGSALANMANYTALYNQLQQQQNQGIRDTDREWGRYKDVTGMGLENMAQNTSRINALTNQQELAARQQQTQQTAEQARGDYKYLEAPLDLDGNPIGEESVFDPNTGVKRSMGEQQAFLRRKQIQQLVDSGEMTPEEAQKALGG